MSHDSPHVSADITTEVINLSSQKTVEEIAIATTLTVNQPVNLIVDLAMTEINLQSSVNTTPIHIETTFYEGGPKGEKGDKGDPGESGIGGAEIIISDLTDNDVLVYDNLAWRNRPKRELVDGGNF